MDTEGIPASRPCIDLHLTWDEIDAIFTILLQAGPLPDVSRQTMDSLLCRVAELKRQLLRVSETLPFSDVAAEDHEQVGLSIA